MKNIYNLNVTYFRAIYKCSFVFLSMIAAVVFISASSTVVQASGSHGGLHDVMELMGDNMKVIVRALVKNKPVPENELLAAANALPGLAIRAGGILPDQLKDKNGNPLPGKEELIVKYQDLMTRLTAALIELEQTLRMGTKEQAKNVLLSKVVPIQREGHEIFK